MLQQWQLQYARDDGLRRVVAGVDAVVGLSIGIAPGLVETPESDRVGRQGSMRLGSDSRFNHLNRRSEEHTSELQSH